jgi:DNA-binding FadR family transcriptional regulator
VNQLLESYEKRDAYGYWDARLKEGFHFDIVRAMAKRRLEQARQAAAALLAEVKDDRP